MTEPQKANIFAEISRSGRELVKATHSKLEKPEKLVSRSEGETFSFQAGDGTELREEILNRRRRRIEFTLDDNCGILPNVADPSLLRMYDTRSSLKKMAHFMETKQFSFEEQYPLEKQKRVVSKEGYLSLIEENLGSFSREPRTGLQPIDFDRVEANLKKKNTIQIKKFVPPLFGTEKVEPLKPYQDFTQKEKVVGVNQLLSKPPDSVTLIRVENQALTKMKIVKSINTFKGTQVLILKNTKVGNGLKLLNLPKLRFLDVTGNEITSYTVLTTILRNSKQLETLTVDNNSFTEKDTDWKYMVLVHGPKLTLINGHEVTDLDREVAVQKFGSVGERETLSFGKWVNIIEKLCKHVHLVKWEPGRFTTLCVMQAQLEEFHVGPFVCLKRLDISQNNITRLHGSGIEELERLVEFNFANNRISNISELEALRYLYSIRELKCTNNPFRENLLEVKMKIIFETRNAKGTNHCPGLLLLNGKSITIRERLDAAYKYTQGPAKMKLKNLKWSYYLIEKFGHRQLRCIPHFSNKVKVIEIPNKGLEYVDLSGFKRLEYLDLRNNTLKSVIGLGELKKLQFLDLSNNEDIDFEIILKDLTKISNLVGLSLFKYNPKNSEHVSSRKKILEVLCPHHPRLNSMDFIEISFEERIISMSRRLNDFQIKKYKFHLAVMLQVVPLEKQWFSHRKVKPNQLYRPEDVMELRLSKFSLEDVGCDFEIFPNLEMIDLSYNKISGLKDLGLQICNRLRVIDLSKNNISASIKELAEFFDNFKFLEVISIAGNPCEKQLKKKDGRLQLLKKLKIMEKIGSRLQVLDSDITNQERLDVMRHHGIIQKTDDSERFKDMLETRGYTEVSPAEITEINLIDAGLRKIDLSKYVNLTYLFLRGNRLESVSKLKNLEQLKVIDVRKNQLTEIDEIVELVNTLKYIESIGIQGNLFERYFEIEKVTIREYLIGKVLKLRKQFTLFWEIDEHPITVDEIAESWCKCTSTTEENNREISIFRFDMALFKKCATNIRKMEPLKSLRVNHGDFVELNLCMHKLNVLHFAKFENLVKLSLKDNLIDDAALNKSGLSKCYKLKQIDLSKNRIFELLTICELLDKLNEIETVNCDENPCYPKEESLGVPLGDDSQPQEIASKNACRLALLGGIERVDQRGFKLQFLNGKEVTISDRCDCLTTTKRFLNEGQIELVRTKLLVEKAGYAGSEDKIVVRSKNISRIDLFLTFKNLKHLDLNGNNIMKLPNTMFTLENLKNLNLQDNALTLDDIVEALQLNRNLTHLGIKGNLNCEKPTEYLVDVITTMRGLKYVDDYFNPFGLNAEQLAAVEYLENNFGISRNSLRRVDVRYKNIEREQFWSILLALRTLTVFVEIANQRSYVGPGTLLINEGNFDNSFISDYRYIVISHLCSLINLDGVTITEAEKHTSAVIRKRLDKMVKKVKSELPNISSNLDFRAVRQYVWTNLKDEDKLDIHRDDVSLGAGDSDDDDIDDENELQEMIIQEEDQNEKKEQEKLTIKVPPKSIAEERAIAEEKDFDVQMVSQLVSMGFDEQKSKKAVKVTHKDGDGSTQDAIDWILKNKDTGSDIGGGGGGSMMDLSDTGSFAVTPVSKKQIDYFQKLGCTPDEKGETKLKPIARNITFDITPERGNLPFKKDAKRKRKGGDDGKTIKDITFKYIEEHHDEIDIFQIYLKLLNKTNRSARSLGNIIEKIEQLIFFLQMFSIIFAFNIPWPTIFRLIFQFISISLFSIEEISFIESYVLVQSRINYLRYWVNCLLPLLFFILFIVSFSKKRWEFLNIRIKFCTLFVIFACWIAGLFVSLLMGFVFDEQVKGYTFYPKTWQNFFPPTGHTFDWPTWAFLIIFGTLAFVSTVICILLASNVFVFAKKSKDVNFWNLFYIKFRRRLAFFFLTITYFPLMRILFVSFECSTPFIEQFYVPFNATNATLRLYNEQRCPPSFTQYGIFEYLGQVPPVYWFSILFGGFFGIGIPVLMALMIWADWKAMYNHFSIEQDDKKENFYKEAYKHAGGNDKSLKQKYVKKRKENVEHYHRCALDFNSAPSFLYSPYKRNYRYYKIFQFVERFLYCAIASLLIGRFLTYIQIGLGFTLLLASCLFTIIFRVYYDTIQNLLDIVSKITNILNLLFGLLLVLQQDEYINWPWLVDGYPWASMTMFIWNGLITILIIFLLVIPTVKEITGFFKKDERDILEILTLEDKSKLRDPTSSNSEQPSTEASQKSENDEPQQYQHEPNPTMSFAQSMIIQDGQFDEDGNFTMNKKAGDSLKLDDTIDIELVDEPKPPESNQV